MKIKTLKSRCQRNLCSEDDLTNLEVEVGGKGDEDADDGDQERRGDPGHQVGLQGVELHPTQDGDLN